MNLQTEQDFTEHGEPKSIIKPTPNPLFPRPSHNEITDGFERIAYNLGCADELYESLRDGGMSHVEARARVEEFLRPTP